MLRSAGHFPAGRTKVLRSVRPIAIGAVIGLAAGALAAFLVSFFVDWPVPAVIMAGAALGDLAGAAWGWRRSRAKPPEPPIQGHGPMMTGLEDRTHL